jgi:FAD/FMN-containing dehydrogenase
MMFLTNSLVFWALRGGGAGSWGVILSATFRIYPTFNATVSTIGIDISNTSSGLFSSVMSSHAAHIKDLDAFRAGQYFTTSRNINSGIYSVVLVTGFPRTGVNKSKNALQPLLEDVKSLGEGVTVTFENYQEALINDILYSPDDSLANALFLGSRLVPEAAYREPEKIGRMYEQLINTASSS